ncbi:hypothetical protein OG252_08360 [Streptomyces sp. NBC_01352]|uniref:Uncharacterized protein n=1 Tax=Streptomyces plumbiresistens TaxID=511811 RepID=A0ABP7S9N1_9ACTN|nr:MULTISPECIES: hypothetical protein [unclassified Streptomyces]MCX4705321.1 hypothetical protein [Streptomyces sp. NBC_01373]
MSGKTAPVESYAHLWEDDGHRHRWVIWNTAGETLVFDRDINCPVDGGDETVQPEVLRRMREAGVPETDEYPGGPCA